MLPRGWWILLVVVWLTPPAVATSPLQADVTLAAPITVDGSAQLATAQGTVNLTPALLRGELAPIAFAEGHGKRVDDSWAVVHGPPPTKLATPPAPAPVDLPAGTLRVAAVGPRSTLALILEGEGRLDAAWTAAGALPLAPAKELFWADFSDPNASNAYVHPVPAGAVALAGETMPGGLARLAVNGTATLLARDVVLEFQPRQGEPRTYDLLEKRTAVGPAAESVASSFLVVTLSRIDARWDGTRATLLAEGGELDLVGTLASPSGRGDVAWGMARRTLVDVPFEATGVIHASIPRGGSPEAAAMRIAGDASSVRLAQAPLAAAEASPALWTSAGALLALALWRSGALAALYTRLRKADILEHPRRRGLYEYVRANPGLNVHVLAREAGMPRMVVHHHLDALARCSLVRFEQDGRMRRVYAADEPPARDAATLARSLRGRRRAVLDALLAQDRALTQRDLVAATGLSQRLVSYHLDALRRLELVEVARGAAQTYAPAPALRAR